MIVRHLTTLSACALLALGPAAQAAPEAQRGDAVLQLLQERGLLPSQVADQVAGNTQALVRQVRDRTSDLVISALNFLGVPYRRGGNGPDQGFDCSGFTRHIFEHSLGLVLPRRADQQANEAGLEPVQENELKPGDLVFFNTMKRAFSHVGIYVGDGKFIHSPRSGGQVQMEDMREAYWARRFDGARRAEAEALSMSLPVSLPAATTTTTTTAPAPRP